MIIYLIILGITVGCVIAFLIGEKKSDYYSNLPAAFLVAGCIFFTVAVICAVAIILEHNPRHQERALHGYQLRREAIVWQMDHNLYVGGTLHEYNAEVYYHQKLHDDPWFSWFEGDYVMQLELIDTGEVSQMH